jgi:serine/threonine-protein kinase
VTLAHVDAGSTNTGAIALGQVIDGRFKVERHLGGGATGDVFEVTQLSTGRRAALKVVKQAFKGDVSMARRFQREARVHALTGCAGIVQTFDAGTLRDGRAFILMELLRGEDLEAWLRRGPVTVADAVDCIVRASLAVHAAHRANIIHRDLKPANLFRVEGPDGVEVKVVDFGIARFLDAPTGDTSGPTGSLLWMAPEQLADSTAVSARSDVFALGATLYTLLAGQSPYPDHSDRLALLDKVARADVVPLHTVAPHVPQAVLAAVARALAPSPEARFESARAFAEALLAAVPTQQDTLAFAATSARASHPPPRPDAVVAAGQHTLLAVSPSDVGRLAQGRVVLLARPGDDALDLSNEAPQAQVCVFDELNAAQAWVGLGLPHAAQVLALTRDDLFNVALARTALDALGERADVANAPRPAFVVRLEDRTLRAAHGADLLDLARSRGVTLRLTSTVLAQARRGLHEGRPSRVRVAGGARVHAVVCGGGALADELAVAFAAAGHGLEQRAPLLTVLRAGQDAVSPGVIERLTASGAVDVQVVDVDVTDEASLARALTTLLFAESPATIFHCVCRAQGDAVALTQLLDRGVAQLGVPPPLLLAYEPGASRQPVLDGARLLIARDDLDEVERRTTEQDRLARAVHQRYLDEHGTSAGPNAVPWEQLPPAVQDDNRRVADHLGWKLDQVGLSLAPGAAVGATVLPVVIVERLAVLEHSRWMAARLVRGWKLGSPHSEPLRLHPSLVPYVQLSDAEQEKDRTQVRALPTLVGALGHLCEDLVCAAWFDAERGPWQALVAELARFAADSPGERLVLTLALLDEGAVALAEALRAAALAYVLVEGPKSARVAVDRRRLSAVRMGAHARVRVMSSDLAAVRAEVFANARYAIVGEATVCGFEEPARYAGADGWLDKGWLVLRSP